MLVEIIMFVGVVIGYIFQPKRFARANGLLQIACTAVLIFSMGVSLGSREGFFAQLQSLGLKSTVYAVIPIIFSVIAVTLLSRRFLKPKGRA